MPTATLPRTSGLQRDDRTALLWRWGLVAALLAGVVLRLVWVEDIEYKSDEAWTVDRLQEVSRGEPLPLVGLPTSLAFRNPGISIWTFLGLGWLTGAREPAELARACQVVNIAAILALVLFALRAVSAEEREPWLWAAALVSVNPLAVLFQRKIWPPSIFPLFSMLLLVAWWRRDRRWGAFACGLLGALLGQLHLSAFIFVAGLATWAFAFDRRRVGWACWLAGSACGLLPLLPWLHYVAHQPWPAQARPWAHLPEPKFWTHWFSEPFGIGLKYALGDDFAAFLAAPVWRGQPTYGVALLHALVGAVAIVIVLRAAGTWWRERHDWRALLIGRRSETAFIVSAAVWGYGLVFNLACLRFYRHYLLVAFPLTFVWAAQLALAPAGPGGTRLRHARVLLLALCIGQALISASFLAFVHQRPDGIHGDYGVPYGAQARAGLLAARPPTAP
jgi:hypothetical protein